MARLVESNRQRFEEIQGRIQQVQAVVEEHDVTIAALEALVASSKTGRAGAKIPIGSGVTLPFSYEGDEEGIAMVDLGAGIYGERRWSDALALTIKRKQDVESLAQELQEQADATEEKIAELATEFNNAAESLQATQAPSQPINPPTPQPAAKPALEPEEESPAKPKRSRRRAGKFGELTLDD